jgi:hypothetical protein
VENFTKIYISLLFSEQFFGYMKAGTTSLKGVSVGTFTINVFVEA